MKVYFDGSCGPKNPGGKACYGYVIVNDFGKKVHQERGLECEGPKATNNVAEYAALRNALKYLKETDYDGPLEIFGDSNLVISQVNGQWKCKKEHLQTYLDEVHDLLNHFQCWEATWIPREQNVEADSLSKVTPAD